MNKKKIAGIDYSLTSPAICIYSEGSDGGHFDFDRCVFHYLSNSKKQQSNAAGSGIAGLSPEPYPEWKTEEERHAKLADWAYNIIQGCTEVYLEGYAFATVGKSHVRSVAENTGLLKNKLWKMKLPFKTYPPTVIKKYATGKGNANKDLMYESFVQELLTPPDLKEILTPKSKKIISPVSDIVDSYFIAKCGVDGTLG
jgi:Holliday junction resolvasome RuvABC endonuclease subunit